MRHKFRVLDHEEENADDPGNGMYSPQHLSKSPVKWISSRVDVVNKIDCDGEGESVQSARAENEHSLSLRARFAIIVGLSLFLWAILIGIAVALLG